MSEPLARLVAVTRTVYLTATSFDGYIADPDHSLQWLFDADDHDGDHGIGEFLEGVGAVCMGRTTYEWVLRHERVADDAHWARQFGGRPVFVFAHAPVPRFAGVDVVEGDVRAVHARMTDAARGRDLWVVGGGDLAGQLADAGLLDEVRLSIAPVALGAGAPLLPRRLLADRVHLEEVGRSGPFVQVTYRLGAPGS